MQCSHQLATKDGQGLSYGGNFSGKGQGNFRIIFTLLELQTTSRIIDSATSRRRLLRPSYWIVRLVPLAPNGDGWLHASDD